MKILVVGAGAVGGYFGARLAKAGHDVTFVARGPHGAAMARHGLHVDTPDGPVHVAAPVVDSMGAAAGLGADLVIVAVKARGLAEVAGAIAPCLAAKGVALPLLNGLDSERHLAEKLGRDRVIGGIANIASELVEPGRVHAREHGSLVLAPLDPEQLDAVTQLAEALAAAGISCRTSKDLDRVLWRKLLWNAPFNAVCALTRLTAGEALAVPEVRPLVHRAMTEVVTVAAHAGVSLPDGVIEATLDATARDFATTVPSMLQDVRAQRPTEANELQGAVVRRARRAGIDAPVHETLWALLQGLEASYRADA
jgi:2-dehydropantoate 2-reductase